jgi:hypothetical protein
MQEALAAAGGTRDNPLLAIIAGGLTAGAIDITYAISVWMLKGVAATRILQSVASGLLGKGAYEGGAFTAVLGGVLHFTMTIIMAAIFVFAMRRIELVRQQLVLAGLLYGAAIYFVMRWVVAPLSRMPGDIRVVNPLELAVHIVGVGLVIALFARRFAGGGVAH